MALADTLIVTAAELQAFGRGEVSALETDAYAETLLSAVQGSFAGWLGYDPLVHKVTRYRPAWAMPFGGFPSAYTAHVAGPHVVQVSATEYEATAGYYTVAVSDDGRALEVLSTNPLPPIVDLWLGWRSSAHTLEGLQALDGLDGLETLPREAPEEVKAALCTAAIYLAKYAVEVGEANTTVDLGSQTRTMESVRPLNDVNVLIGRVDEMRSAFALAHRWKRVSA